MTRAKFYPLPERFFWNYGVQKSVSQSSDRIRTPSGDLSLIDRPQLVGRTAAINFGADSRPFDFFHHRFEAVRNLELPDSLRNQIGFVNLGRVVTWNQSMDTRYSMNRGAWLRPGVSWNAQYSQDNGPVLSPDLSVALDPQRAVGDAELRCRSTGSSAGRSCRLP